MRKALLFIVLTLILLQSCSNGFNGIKISGKVNNSNQEYVYLAYQPLYRGNLNFDGFKSIGDRIDNKGNFFLLSGKIIDAADYWIQVKDKAFHLVLFNGDNIKLEFDLNDIESSLFAKGKGAGKINVLRLPQLKSNLRYDKKYTMDKYKSIVDSTINSQLLFLNVIYKKDISNKILDSLENKQTIIDIITETPLSEKEYEFIKKKISIQDIYYLGGFISYLNRYKLADTSNIDFTKPYFKCFNLDRYRMIDNINYWQFENCINNILRMEYLKSIQKDSIQLKYSNFGIKDYSKYRNWSIDYARSYLNQEVFDAYYASTLTKGLSLGNLNTALYKEFADDCNNDKYLKRINGFNDLLNNGLNNIKYCLNSDDYELSMHKFDSLLKNYIGRNVYIIIWSAKYAGATLISELPSIIDFQKENQREIEFLNICIDEEKHKGLWAARIIDNSWKGNHYFLPSENNDSLINLFSAQNISGFCDGGVTYSFVDKNGNITNNIEAPIMMTKEKLDQYIGNAVH